MSNIELNSIIYDELECEIINALINRDDARSLILSKIKIDNFVNQNNRLIFRIVKELNDSNDIVDIISIKTKLEADDSEQPKVLFDHLTNNILSLGYVDNLDSKIQVLINKSTKAKTDYLAKKIIESNIDFLNPEESFDAWTTELDEIINSRNIGELELIQKFVEDYQKKLESSIQNQGKLTGTTSGYEEIDKITNGFQKGDLIILAARPSMGKTALAINFILNAAKSISNYENEAVVFFSLEMSTEQIIQRMITNLACIDGNKIRKGDLDNNTIKLINFNLDKLKSYPIYIEDKANMNILEIESRLRQLIQNSKIKLVVVDYLQLIETTGHSYNRVQEVGKISRKLKIMARELNVPIIAIAQLSRRIEERKAEDRQPMLSDLRESGSIEQDADLVTFIDYDRNQIDNQKLMKANKAAETNSDRVQVMFYIEKHRNGTTGRVKLWFNKHEGRFLDYKEHEKEKFQSY